MRVFDTYLRILIVKLLDLFIPYLGDIRVKYSIVSVVFYYHQTFTRASVLFRGRLHELARLDMFVGPVLRLFRKFGIKPQRGCPMLLSVEVMVLQLLRIELLNSCCLSNYRSTVILQASSKYGADRCS